MSSHRRCDGKRGENSEMFESEFHSVPLSDVFRVLRESLSRLFLRRAKLCIV
jgi:hypothetical protein